MILEECRPKHFMFRCFSISCIDCTLKTFEFLYACTSQKIVWEVYVLEFCPKNMNENYVLDLFGYAISKSFTGINMFGRCITTGFFKEHFRYKSILPNIFSMKHFGRYFKKGFWKYNDSREMLQKKTTDF